MLDTTLRYLELEFIYRGRLSEEDTKIRFFCILFSIDLSRDLPGYSINQSSEINKF